jgi:iron complex outermembrane receptor protein
MRNVTNVFVLLAPLLTLNIPVYAQKVTDEELESYTVTARPLGGSSQHIAQPVQIINGEELSRREAGSLGETLDGLPGISSADFGQTVSRPVIRGLGGLRVRLLESGIAAMDLSDTSADHAVSIEPAGARQIEILKGPSTLLYGSGAIGGVVNVVDNRIPDYVPDNLEAAFKVRRNNVNDESMSRLDVDAGQGDFAVHVDASWRDTGDYRSSIGEVANSASRTTGHAIGAAWLGDDDRLGIAYSRYNSTYGIPTEDTHIELSQQRYELKGSFASTLPGLRQIDLRMAFNNYQHAEIEGDGAIGSLFENDAYEGRLEFLHQPVDQLSGLIGIQFGARDFSATGAEAFLPSVENDHLAVFMLERLDWESQHLEVGLRYEYQDYNPARGLQDVRHNLYSLSAELVSALGNDHSIALSFSRSQRAPAAEELYADGPHLATGTFETGSITLSPETANNLDLSLRRQVSRWHWSASVFVNLIEDFIFEQSRDSNGDGLADRVTSDGIVSNDVNDLLSQFYTQSNALFYGLELESRYRIFDDQRGKLALTGFFDTVRGRLTSGADLPRITPPRLGTGLNYERGEWHARVDLMHVLAQKNNAALETETAAYTLLSADINRRIVTNSVVYTLRLNADNLLDSEARRHTSFLKDNAPLPGRAWGVELQVNY